jgi:hypothetical protein
VALGTEDDLKRACSDAASTIIAGCPVTLLMPTDAASAPSLWPGPDRSLWTAALFPVHASREVASAWAIQMLQHARARTPPPAPPREENGTVVRVAIGDTLAAMDGARQAEFVRKLHLAATTTR